MPIEMVLWRVDQGKPQMLSYERMEQEARLQDLLAQDISVLGLDLLVIGREVITDHGGRIDLLGMDADGDLYVVELKRDRTPRDVVAQVLDYGAWVVGLGYDDVIDVHERYRPGEPLEAVFEERFGTALPDALNNAHHLFVVAAALDGASERIVGYLGEQYGMSIDCIFFRFLRDGDREYLARTWLRGPTEATGDPTPPRKMVSAREQWNGRDFYVSAGEGPHRRWSDMVRYGYVSSGGGQWYSRTMSLLMPEARIFVYVPGAGYVGVGTVVEGAVPVSQFEVEHDGRMQPLLTVPLEAPNLAELAVDDENVEMCVRVDWIKTLPRERAIRERGLYANQNSVTKLRNKFTLDVLRERFDLSD